MKSSAEGPSTGDVVLDKASLISNAEDRMKKAIGSLKDNYAKVRAGRANPAILDGITVDYYGAQTPIGQVASIAVSESRILVIQPWDISILNAIERAINKSDIGINPQNDGRVIRLIFPPLTEEMRKSIAKEVRTQAEDTKVAVRNIRRDSNDKLKALKNSNQITEDEQRSGENTIQTLTDKFVKEIDDVCKSKEEEVLNL